MKPQFYIVVLLLFSLFSISCFAQKKQLNIDSLYVKTKNIPDTPKKVDELIGLYKQSVRQRDIKKDILEDALKISQKIYYIKGIGVCYNRMGLTARYEQDYQKSIMFHKRALSYFEKSKDTFYKIKTLNNLGVTYRKLNLEKEAFNNYFRALKLSEKIDNKRSVSIALNGIGNVFLNIEDYDKALYYFKKDLALEKIRKTPRGKEYSMANIGEVYLHQKEYDSAYYYFNYALQLAEKNPHKENIAIKNTLLGLLYQKKGDYQVSNDFYRKAIPQLKEYKNTRYLSKCFLNIGINQLHLKRYNKAYKNITEGLQMARSIKSKENIMLGYNALVDYYSLTNNYKQALVAHKKAKIFHDSIVNLSSKKSIISTQIAYETYKKDQEIQQLAIAKATSEKKAKSNYFRFILTSLLSLLVIGILLFSFQLSKKNKKLELEQKNRELQNYLLQISELKDKVASKNTLQNSDKELSKKLKEFDLSKREIEVLTHISHGLSNVEIAEKMFISNNTIKTHITHIYAKLDVKNRVQAIKKFSV